MLYGAIALRHPANSLAVGLGGFNAGGVGSVGGLVGGDLLVVIGADFLLGRLGGLVLDCGNGLFHLRVQDRLRAVVFDRQALAEQNQLGARLLLGIGAVGDLLNAVIQLIVVGLVGFSVQLFLGLVQRKSAAIEFRGEQTALHRVFQRLILQLGDHFVVHAHAEHGIHLVIIAVHRIERRQNVHQRNRAAVVFGHDFGVLFLERLALLFDLPDRVGLCGAAGQQHRDEHHQRAKRLERVFHEKSFLLK